MNRKFTNRIRSFWVLSNGALLALAVIGFIGAVEALDLVRFVDNRALGAAIVLLSGLAGFSLLRLLTVAKENRQEAVRSDLREREALMRDHATGALMRRHFLEICEGSLQRMAPDERFAYVAIDLDYLKILNDSFGHEVGDRALARIVNAVIECFGKDALVGRLGGDEFAVLLPCETSAGAISEAERLIAAIRRPVLIRGHELSLSASLGVVLVPEHTRFLSEAVQFADLALYEGKKGGRDRAALFDRTMLLQFFQERQIERELRLGLERDEFCRSYVPVYDAAGRPVAARMRPGWVSRWLGPVERETFLRIAQGSNLIHRIAQGMLTETCRDVAGLRDVAVVIDVFPAQLKRDDLVGLFRQAIEAAGIEPGRIVASVTGEIAEMARQPQVLRRLRDLRALGVRIVLDDLSSLVCNFDQLREFPLDFVRIPERQIMHLGESDIDNVMVSAMASVGSAMGLGVTADGIHNAEQLLLARTAGCTLFSGPHFGPELSAAELGEALGRVADIRGAKAATLP